MTRTAALILALLAAAPAFADTQTDTAANTGRENPSPGSAGTT